MYIGQSLAVLAAGLSCFAASALAADTYSYEEYLVTRDWSYNTDPANVKWTNTMTLRTGVADGATFTSKNPPYYKFLSASGTPSFTYQKYIYHSGYSQELVNCPKGSWQDTSVVYETGPDFFKKYPKDAWTLCSVGNEGGLGGGSNWFIMAANFKKTTGGGGDAICTSKCRIANNAQYGDAYPPNAPPCWQKEAGGYYSCFDYAAGSKNCPWGGMTDCKGTQPTTVPSSNSCAGSCLVANYAPYGWKSGSTAPPCWQKEAAGYYSCFDYAAGTTSCPWAGMINCRKV